MPGKYPSKAVANWFIDQFHRHGRPITQLQVHKLVYLGHGYHLAVAPEAGGLVAEVFRAWKFGPVLPSLRDEFREFGNRPITKKADEWIGDDELIYPDLGDHPTEDWETDLLDWVFMRYGHLSGPQLIDLTHMAGSPWYNATNGGRDAASDPAKVIPNDDIGRYFRSELDEMLQRKRAEA